MGGAAFQGAKGVEEEGPGEGVLLPSWLEGGCGNVASGVLSGARAEIEFGEFLRQNLTSVKIKLSDINN